MLSVIDNPDNHDRDRKPETVTAVYTEEMRNDETKKQSKDDSGYADACHYADPV